MLSPQFFNVLQAHHWPKSALIWTAFTNSKGKIRRKLEFIQFLQALFIGCFARPCVFGILLRNLYGDALVSLAIITSTFITFLGACCIGGLFRVSEHLQRFDNTSFCFLSNNKTQQTQPPSPFPLLVAGRSDHAACPVLCLNSPAPALALKIQKWFVSIQ